MRRVAVYYPYTTLALCWSRQRVLTNLLNLLILVVRLTLTNCNWSCLCPVYITSNFERRRIAFFLKFMHACVEFNPRRL